MSTDASDYLSAFRSFAENIEPDFPDWAKQMVDALPQLTEAFDGKVATDKKYDLLIEAQKFFGVRDSISDQVVAEPGQTQREQMQEATWRLLQATWRELGRPAYSFEEFEVYPDGSSVKLVSSKIAYFDLDGTPHLVPDICWLESHSESNPLPSAEETLATVWEVDCEWGPDITNAPLYFCCEGPNGRTAEIRHEALQLATVSTS